MITCILLGSLHCILGLFKADGPFLKGRTVEGFEEGIVDVNEGVKDDPEGAGKTLCLFGDDGAAYLDLADLDLVNI